MIFPKRIDTSITGRIVDIRKAFNADAYLSAISLALTIPVIGDKLVDPRYYFDGEDCYQLRCAYLHQGVNTPDRTKPKTVYNVIQFEASPVCVGRFQVA